MYSLHPPNYHYRLQYHPSGFGFASCSEDQTARMYDLRADQQIAQYEPPQKNTGFTSCGGFSFSVLVEHGRLDF